MGLFFRKKKITFTIPLIVETDDDRFHAYCPALRGLHAEGDTEEEACKNAADAAIAYIQSLIKHDDPIPLGIMVKEESQKSLPMMPPPLSRECQVPVAV